MVRVEQVPVTGREQREQLTPQMRALSEFYQALNRRDLELMADNWAQTDEAVMDNPVGGIKRGWGEIKEVYAQIFSHPEPFWLELHDYSYHEAGEVFYVVGQERGEYRSGGEVLRMSIRTSRVFRLIDRKWRQVHHHGSIDDAELLGRYQRAVRGG
jgi:ketosteroid isomerase-like protein